MSRPGFVFDLAAPEVIKAMEFTCRGCGVMVGGGSSNTELHARLKIHVRERHALENADEWKITHHDRGGREMVVCFWPPEAL
jgi:predicted small metal-binding protein